MATPPPAPYPPELVAWARDRSRRAPLTPAPGLRVLAGDAHNRSCGDRLTLQLGVDAADTIAVARFSGEGCALCMAAAAALSAHLEGASIAAAPALVALLPALLSPSPPPSPPPGLAPFRAVAPFSARHLCVTLSADAATAALATLAPESP
jgi:nitrogen fixation NifU-like protein